MIPNPGVVLTATIANGATASSVIDTGGGKVAAIGFPASMTGTTMTFEAGTNPNDLSTFKQIVNEAGAAYSITVTASKVVALSTAAVALACRYVRLVSGTAEGGARTLHVFVK